MKKQFEHNRIEKCFLCKKDIDTKKDRWNVIIDYVEDKLIKIGFYHQRCLTDLITAKGEIIKEQFEDKMSGFVKRIFDRAGVSDIIKDSPKEEVVVIK